MPSMFDFDVYNPPINSLGPEITGPVWDEARTLGEIAIERPLALSASAEIQAIHGLTLLALRQSEAIHTLGVAGLSDQALGLCRSLFETLVNLAFVTGQGEKVAERTIKSEEFIDFFAMINRKYLNHAKELKRSQYQDAGKVGQYIEANFGNKIDADTNTYLAKYSKPRQYWNDMSPSVAAEAKDLALKHFYAWCCSFSHSNVYACRSLFAQEGQEEPEFRPRKFVQPLLFVSTFLLLNVLGLFFGSFEEYQTQFDEVQNLADRLRVQTTTT